MSMQGSLPIQAMERPEIISKISKDEADNEEVDGGLDEVVEGSLETIISSIG
jgi:hypothetical protein